MCGLQTSTYSCFRYIDDVAEETKEAKKSKTGPDFGLTRRWDDKVFKQLTDAVLTVMSKDARVVVKKAQPFSQSSVIVVVPEPEYSIKNRADDRVITKLIDCLGGSHLCIGVWRWTEKKGKDGAKVGYFEKYKSIVWVGLWLSTDSDFFSLAIEKASPQTSSASSSPNPRRSIGSSSGSALPEYKIKVQSITNVVGFDKNK